ncbi:MAG: N-acetylmuramoyl-L-alanine amidase [Acidobacteriia bacterium]|nr:N-acetylmuramoyl-L-alanine amidase [Terriglobia bacterium]
MQFQCDRKRRLKQLFFPVLLGAVASVGLISPLLASPENANKRQRAKTAFEKAEQLRAGLDGRPISSRKLGDYDRVIHAYKLVYDISPVSSYADDALLAVAELHNQMGGDLKKPEYNRKAIQDYELLIHEYPYSKFVKDALFTIGLIYQDDLGDHEAALKVFERYLEKYKQGPKVVAARENVRQLKQRITLEAQAIKPALPEKTPPPKPTDVTREPPQGKSVDSSRLPRVSNIRHWSTSNYTRIVIDVDSEVQFDQSRLANPDRIFFDLRGARLSSTLSGKTFPVEDGFLREIRAGQFQSNIVRIVLDLDRVQDYTVFPLYDPYRLVIDIRGANPPTEKPVVTAEKVTPAPTKPPEIPPSIKKQEPARHPDEVATEKPTATPEKTDNSNKAAPSEPVQTAKGQPRSVLPKEKAKGTDPAALASPHAAKPKSDGELSLTRSLGLKIGKIVIDPGHGGHDYGTIGPGGLAEKDLCLDVSLRLGKLIEEKLGSQVVYTRDDDTFVPLENRTALANQKQADLFISIHANSSRSRSASGVETFFLGIASSHDQETLDVVARENAYSERSLHDLQDVIKKITLNEKVEESREFAGDIQKAIATQTAQWNRSAKNRGVKKAHFIVLIGANMPSILTEISFLSNPNDERMLKKPDYRQKLAQALFGGIFNYVKTLSGVKVAKKIETED